MSLINRNEEHLGHCERSRVDRAISLTPTLLKIAEQNEQFKFAAQTFFWVQITLDEVLCLLRRTGWLT